MIYIFLLIINFTFGLVRLKDNLNINGKLIPRDHDLIILNSKLISWYKLYEEKSILGYVDKKCTNISSKGIIVLENCIIFKKPNESSDVVSILKKDKTYTIYKDIEILFLNLSYKGIKFWINSSKVYIEPKDISELQKVDIEKIVKINDKKIYTSKNFDKTMYFSSYNGLYISYNGKDWYKNESLKEKKYEITITKQGWVIADNLYSKDFGITFSELYPEYAFPFKETYVKSVIASPQSEFDIYMTFSSYKNNDKIALFVINTKNINDGWKKIYPNKDNKLISIKVEDTFTSVLNYSNNYISKKYKSFEINDISIKKDNNKYYVDLLLSNNKNELILILELAYNIETGWEIKSKSVKKI